jgi:hypothetical protein
MLPYFAKYLPVKGEIKEGEICFVDDGQGNTGYLPFKKVYTTQGEPFPKKVKLFLCSRDIQVGDKCVGFTGGEWFDVTVSDPTKLIDTYKVIGEISPEATWVKEGDEFDEDEWRERYWDTEVNRFLNWKVETVDDENTNIVNALKEGILKKLVELKGPCGHFH